MQAATLGLTLGILVIAIQGDRDYYKLEAILSIATAGNNFMRLYHGHLRLISLAALVVAGSFPRLVGQDRLPTSSPSATSCGEEAGGPSTETQGNRVHFPFEST